MTARQLFENALIELSKVKAPSLLLEDFNYLINKSIYLYVNKRYNLYDTSQLTTDDIRVLKTTALLEPKLTNKYSDINQTGSSNLAQYKNAVSNLYGGTYEIELPYDYYHMLNCICIYKVNKKHKCYPAGSFVEFSATKLDSDKWSQIINDYYNRPTPQRPYYFLHNVNTTNREYTNPFTVGLSTGVHETSGTDLGFGGKSYITTGHEIWNTNIGFKIRVKVSYDSVTGVRTYSDPAFIDTTVDKRIDELFHTSGNKLNIVTKDNRNVLRYTDTTYLIHNKNTNDLYALSHDVIEKDNSLEDVYLTYIDSASTFDRSIMLTAQDNLSETVLYVDLVNKPSGNRHANSSLVRCEIRYGKDVSIFELVGVSVDYIKAPLYVELTPEQMDLTEDTSQILEFPDYVCQEIINELVHVIMENNADPRLQTHATVSQSIASPAQQLTQQAAQAAQ